MMVNKLNGLIERQENSVSKLGKAAKLAGQLGTVDDYLELLDEYIVANRRLMFLKELQETYENLVPSE